MEKAKKLISNKFYRTMYCVIAAFLVAIHEQIYVLASGSGNTGGTNTSGATDAQVDAIVKQGTAPIDAIVKIIFGIFGGLGMLIFARGLSNLLAAWGDHDTTTIRHEAVQCGIGITLGSIGTLVAIFYHS